MKQMRRYPLGEQSFSKLREQGRVYVDKTEQVYRLTHLSSDYIFLSRPAALADNDTARRYTTWNIAPR